VLLQYESYFPIDGWLFVQHSECQPLAAFDNKFVISYNEQTIKMLTLWLLEYKLTRLLNFALDFREM